ncbi:hypothetical protein FTUN_8138 [Frigoriglobus tundricola]|uniref:Uncharacterized protein n=1 Tax=Frigoriglobus tundricola TaxID=2774151 RepID=A0A6M5Z240_9BACT|nr:hypothetical protein FTUN_8138 [Frigoriglobus tundricola]
MQPLARRANAVTELAPNRVRLDRSPQCETAPPISYLEYVGRAKGGPSEAARCGPCACRRLVRTLESNSDGPVYFCSRRRFSDMVLPTSGEAIFGPPERLGRAAAEPSV